MKNPLPLLILLLTALCCLPAASLYSQDRLTADPQISLDRTASSDFFALSADLELKSESLTTSTCVPGSVARDKDDPWSEECYLNNSCGEQGNPCTSNSVNLLGAYLADINGNPIETCDFNEPTTVYLWGRFQNGTATTRYAVRTRTEVWINGAYYSTLNSCSFDILESGVQNMALIGEFEFTCGDALEFRSTWVAWSSSNSGQCMTPTANNYRSTCGDYNSSSCSKDLGRIVLLSPNFAYTCAEFTETTTQVCFQDNTTGGAAPLTYHWNFGDGNTSVSQDPCHTYSSTSESFDVTLTVTDNNGVVASATKTLDLENLFCPNPQLSISKSTTFTEGCVSEGDIIPFEIVVENTGNQNISNIVVNDPMLDFTSVQFNLTPGAERTYTVNYTVQQSDINAGGFTNTATATGTTPAFNEISVSDQATVVLNAFPSLQASVYDVDCKGAATGKIELRGIGGKAPYSFEWLHDAQLEGPDADNLSAGSYTVTLTDARGCSVTSTYVVKEPTEGLELTSVNVVDESCPGANDGKVTIVVKGGTPPLSIVITDGEGNVYPAESDQLDKSQSMEEASAPVRRGSTTSSTPTRRGMEEDKALPLPSNTVTFIAHNLPAGDFSFVVTDENGCPLEGDFEVKLISLRPTIEPITDFTVCEGEEITLTAVFEHGTISWDNNVVNGVPFVITETTTFTATVSNDCDEVTESVTVTVNPLPTIEEIADFEVCEGEEITLAAVFEHGTISWDNDVVNGVPFVITETTTFTATVSNDCDEVTESVTVTVNPLPTIEEIADFEVCEGEEITLTAVFEHGTISWDNDVVNGVPFVITETTTFTATVTNDCDIVTESVTVYVDPLPTIEEIANFTVCEGEEISLTAVFANGTLSWDNNVVNGEAFVITETTTFTATVTNDCDIVTESVTVYVDPLPTIEEIADFTVCEGEEITLTAVFANGTLSWDNNVVNGEAFVITETTTFTATVTNDCDIVTESVTVYVDPLPTIEEIANFTVCEGEEITLTAVFANGTLSWDNNVVNGEAFVITETTTFTATVTNDCDIVTESVTVYVDPLPTIEEIADFTVCEGEEITLTAVFANGTLSWDNNVVNGEAFVITETTTFTATVTNDCDIVTESVTVTVDPLPTIEEIADFTVCEGEEITLTAVFANGTLSWDNNVVNGEAFVITETTTFTATVTNDCDIVTESVTVYVDPLPTIEEIADFTVCEGEEITLTAVFANGTLSWDNNVVNGEAFVITETTTFTATVTNDCDIVTESVTVYVDPLPTIEEIANFTVCEGEEITLTAVFANGTLSWDNNVVNGEAFVITETTTFTATVTNDCDIVTESVTVYVDPLPTIEEIADFTVCEGEEITLTAVFANGTLSWDNNVVNGEAFVITETTTFTATVTNDCDIVTESVTVTVDPLPTIEEIADFTVCEGEEITLTAVFANGTLSWDNNVVNGEAFVITETTTFTATVTNDCDIVTESVTVYVDPLPTIEEIADFTVCEGEEITLTAVFANGTLSWDNNVVNGEAFVITETTTFTATVTNDCDIVTESVTVYVDPLPTIEEIADFTVCEGEEITLTAVFANGTLSWDNNVVNGEAFVITETTTFTATVTNDCDIVTESVTVTVDPLPTIEEIADFTVCEGEEITLTAVFANGTLSWDNNVVNGEAFVITETTTFTATVTNDCDIVTESVTVYVDPLPTIEEIADFTVCEGEEITLTAVFANGTLSWDNNVVNGEAFIITETTTFTATVTNDCDIVTESVTVTVDPLPTIQPIADFGVCEGEEITLTAIFTNGTLSWDNNVVNGETFVINETTTFTATVTNDCDVVTESVTVTVNPLPTIEPIADFEACPGEEITLEASYAFGTISWDNDVENGQAFTINETTTFTATVSSDLGCVNGEVSESVTVTVKPLPSLEPLADFEVCEGEEITLTAVFSNGTLSWDNDVVNGETFVITETTTFTATVTNDCDEITESLTITVNPLPTIEEIADFEACEGEEITLTAVFEHGSVSWDKDVVNGEAFVITETTTFTATVTNDCGTVTESVTVTVNPLPTIDEIADFEVCEGEEITLSAVYEHGTVSWDNDVVNAEAFVITETTTFTATVTNDCGSVTETVTVTVNPLPTIEEIADFEACEGEEITLTAVFEHGSVSWDKDVVNGEAFIITETTTFTATVTNDCGSVTETVTVTVNPLPTIEEIADFEVCEGEEIILTALYENGTLTWDNDVVNGEAFVITETTTFTATVTNDCGSVTETVTVTVNPLPTIEEIADFEACEGEEITLTAVFEHGSVSWDKDVVNGEAFIITETTTFTATVTNDCGSVTETVTVTVNPLPTIEEIADFEVCEGEEIILTALYENGTLTWDNDVVNGEAFIIFETTTFTATVTNDCDIVTETVTVTVTPLPILTCPTDFTIGIIAAPIALSGAEPEGGEYSGPGVEDGIFDPAVAGLGEHTIYYTYEAENECVAVCSFVITVVEMPDFTCIPDFSVCNDDMPVALEQENYAGGVFSGEGVTDNVFDPQALEPGVYEITYTYTDAQEHVYTCFFYITVHPAAEASLEPFAPVCSNTEAFALEGGLPEGGVYYVNGVESTMFDPMAAADGIHEISYVFTDANGCTATAVEQIEVLLAPCVDIIAEDVLCHGEDTGRITVDITCGEIAKICLLYPGESIEQCLEDKSATSVTFNGLAPGTYTVIVKAVNGCITIKEATINEPQEGLAMTADITHLQEYGDGTGAITLNVTGGTPPYQYVWDNGEETATIENLQTGTYFVTVFDANGCFISDEFEVTHPSILVDLGVTIEVNIQTPDPNEVDELIFALVVTNHNQEEDATGVVVENIIPEPFPFIARLDDGTSGSFNPTTGVWNLGTVPAGEYRILVYRTEMLLTEEEEKSWQYGVNTAQILPFDQIDPILENNYAEIVVTIGESTSGDDNGIESNGSMASQLALRNHRRLVEPNHIPRAERAERMASFSHTDMLIGGLKSATVEGQDPTGISMLLPEEGPANTRAFVSTPADLMGITNAKEMFAVDYLQENNSRRAAILAISTEPSRVYEHTKVICDRLVGAELRDINIMTIAGKPFIVSQLVHPNGYVDYSVSFIAQRKNGRFVIDNRWYNEEYELYNTDDVFNFQVWSVTPQFTRELVEDILEMMEQTGGVDFRNQTIEPQIPQVFVHSGRYTNGGLLLNLVNRAGADRITIQGNKTLVENGERVPMNLSVSIPTQEFVEVFIPTGYLFDAGFAIKNNKDSAPDVLYYADGAWMIDYDPGNAFVADFNTYKETAELEARDYKVERDATFSGSVRTWASMFRALSPRNAPVDLSSYNQVVFTASGKGTVEVMLAKAGIHNWGEQYRTTITLTDSPKEYVISFRELANREGVREFTPEDVVSVIFNPIGNGNAETAFEVNVTNLHFTNSLFVQKNNAVFYPAYPNPFRNQTSVELSLLADNPVKVEVLNAFGQVIEVIKNEVLQSGNYKINWDAARHTPGVYMIRLIVGTDVYTTKVIHQR